MGHRPSGLAFLTGEFFLTIRLVEPRGIAYPHFPLQIVEKFSKKVLHGAEGCDIVLMFHFSVADTSHRDRETGPTRVIPSGPKRTLSDEGLSSAPAREALGRIKTARREKNAFRHLTWSLGPGPRERSAREPSVSLVSIEKFGGPLPQRRSNVNFAERTARRVYIFSNRPGRRVQANRG